MSPDDSIISYDSRFDILYYSNGQKSHFSKTQGRVTVDFNHDRQVVGLEIESASDFFSGVLDKEVSEDDVHEIQRISFTQKRIDNILSVIIEIEILLDGEVFEERTELNVGSTAQVVA